jgi:hypothetical protein
MKGGDRKIKNLLGFAILLLSVFLIGCSIAYSASFYYVDKSVASSGNGTQSSPWKNLANINWSTINGASKPCTIYVSGGAISQTYAENWAVGASGIGVGNEVIIKRPTSAEWPGHGGVVYIPSPSSSFDIGGVHYVIIDGFDMTGVYGGVYLFDGSTYITIQSCPN